MHIPTCPCTSVTTRHLFVTSCALFCLATFSVAAARFGLLVVTIEGQSMYPTLNSGERVLAMRRWPVRWLRKGQIVLVDPWRASNPARRRYFQTEKPFIKRIAAVTGENIVTSITDLYDVLRPAQLPFHDEAGKRVWHIPPGSIFVLSDNRPAGMDSLTWGAIPSTTVLGVVIATLPGRNARLRGTPE